MSLLTLVGYGFTAVITISCVRYLLQGGLKEDFEIFKGYAALDWLELLAGGLLVIGFVICCYFVAQLGPRAVFDWTWLSLLAKKGEAVQAYNQVLAGASIKYFGIPFMILLFLNLPSLARAEEEQFREGTRDWLQAVPRSLVFGLAHMIVGVPLWCGLALAIPGMWFTGQYFKGGVKRSTTAHSLYNMIWASALIVYLVFTELIPHR